MNTAVDYVRRHDDSLAAGGRPGMSSDGKPLAPRGWPALAIASGLLASWTAVCALPRFPSYLLPSPRAVAVGLAGEVRSGRLADDVIASLFRVAVGFSL